MSKQNISAQERLKRLRAVEEAHASLAMAGLHVSAEEQEHAARYITGDLSLQEFMTGESENPTRDPLPREENEED